MLAIATAPFKNMLPFLACTFRIKMQLGANSPENTAARKAARSYVLAVEPFECYEASACKPVSGVTLAHIRLYELR